MGIPHDGSFGAYHLSPSLEVATVLIDDRRHHGAHIEGALTSWVRFVVKDLANGLEVEPFLRSKDEVTYRTRCGVFAFEKPRHLLARGDVAVPVVFEERLIRLGQVTRVVLRLAIRPHHPFEAANRLFVFRRHGPRRFESSAPGQHHGGARGHDEGTLGVHQHGGERVEVTLRANVDSLHDQIDLATRLGEMNDTTHHTRGGVEVFGAAVHRDLCTTRYGNPLDGNATFFCEVECCDQSIALAQ